jgi:hypothetical protein
MMDTGGWTSRFEKPLSAPGAHFLVKPLVAGVLEQNQGGFILGCQFWVPPVGAQTCPFDKLIRSTGSG